MAREKGVKDKIEGAALRLFVERGVAETSIREIAVAAGVSQGWPGACSPSTSPSSASSCADGPTSSMGSTPSCGR